MLGEQLGTGPKINVLRLIWQDVAKVQEMDPNLSVAGFPIDVLVRGMVFHEIGIAESVMNVVTGQKSAKEVEERLVAEVEPLVSGNHTFERIRNIAQTIKSDVHLAMLEADRLQKDSLRALSCEACGGPVAVHDETCGWCDSGLPME